VAGAAALASVAAVLATGDRPAVVLVLVAGLGAVALAWPSRAGRWAAGAAGERRTAAALEGVEADGYDVLHDVRLPGRRWNLDHVLLGPAGVVVVDSKQWRRPTRVARRWPKVVEQTVGWQIDAVAAALPDELTVHGFVCVHGAQVKRRWWTGARWAPIGDGAHLRRWLRRLPSGHDGRGARKAFEPRH
jgi:hypothetical protein